MSKTAAEQMIYAKAVNSNVMIGGSVLMEGHWRLVPKTPKVEKLEAMHVIKTFATEKEARDYKFLPLAQKGARSIGSFAPKPQPPRFDAETDSQTRDAEMREHRGNVQAWADRQKDALVTPFGDPTELAVEEERQVNGGDAQEPDAQDAEGATEGSAKPPKKPHGKRQ